MAKASVRLYPSGSGVVLIGMNWTPPKGTRFFGFAIRRTPGFYDPIPVKGKLVQANFSWLENRLSFAGKTDAFTPSNLAPIQKFQWWDARFHPEEDAGKTFTYEVIPMTGQANALVPVPGAAASAKLAFPARDAGGVGVWFNRPFVSSQAFSRLLQRLKVDPKDPKTLTDTAKREIYAWLGNGLEQAVPTFVAGSKDSELSGAIYHLTDPATIAALTKRSGSMVLHWKDPSAKTGKGGDTTDKGAEDKLKKAKWQTSHRKSGNLMHNKILVESKGQKLGRLLMGSANFTLEGYTTQANVLHAWKTTALSSDYLARVRALFPDPATATLKKSAGWSAPIALGGGATARIFFSPETDGSKDRKWQPASIKPIVDAISKAHSSVVLCLYDPTDENLLGAVFDAIGKNRAAFGLLNTLPGSEPSPTTKAGKKTPGYAIKKKLFDFTRTHNEIVSAQGFLSPMTFLPAGFLTELRSLPAGKKADAGFDPSTIHVHHKFVLIDGETESPTLFTGSANLSMNSATRNDENTLWIEGHKGLSRAYLAEFMRLFEHYRSRSPKLIAKGKDPAGKKTRPPLRLDDTGTAWWPGYFKPSSNATARKSFGG